MADNTPTTSGDLISTDDLTQINGAGVSGVKVQRVKAGWGLDGELWDVRPSTGFGQPVQGEVNGGAATGTHRPVLAGGIDSGNLARTIRTATDGTLLVNGVQDARTTGAIIASTTVVGPVSVTNRNVVTFSISGAHAGVSFVIEATDDGSTWFGLQSINNATGVASATWTPGTNAVASYDAAVGGYTQVRVRATAYASGSATVGINAQVFAYDPVVAAIAQGPAAPGTAVLGNPVLTGGSDGTNVRSVLLDTSGRLVVVGAAANAAAVAGNPVLVAGSDGTNARNLAMDTNGRLVPRAADLHVTSTGTAGAATTLTLAAAGAGLFHYITALEIVCYSTAARTGGATPVTVTTTNLNSMTELFSSAAAVGALERVILQFPAPVRAAAANIVSTVVGPATTSVIWSLKAWYYTAT